MLTLEPGESERLAQGAPDLQRRYQMPIDPRPYPRAASSEPACRAVVGARLHTDGLEEDLLRRLRVRAMAGGLLDDPGLLAAAVRDVGLDPLQLEDWSNDQAVDDALQDDVAAARAPSPAARALGHKLGGPSGRCRYTAPSYEIRREDGGGAFSVPGFNPREVYEAAIANLAPELSRRAAPENVEQVLEWAKEPLATAEIAALMQADPADVRPQMSGLAEPQFAGADCYWTRA